MKHINLIPAELHLQVYIFSFACYLGLIMAGMTMSWPAPLTAWFHSQDSEIPMTENEVSWMVSIMAFSSAVASIPSGMLADMFGRKTVLLGTGVTSMMGWILIMTTRSKWALYMAQFLGGTVAGGVPSVAPIYISEISPPKIRGAIIGQLNTMISIGLLIVNVIGPLLSYTNYIRVCSTTPILFFIFFWLAPESPYYLLSKGREEEANNAMARLRGKESIAELEVAKKESLGEQSKDKLSIWEMLKQNNYMKNMICLQILSSVSMFNGTPSVVTYAVEFLGGPDMAIVMSIVYVVSSFLAAFLADPIGRKPLLISSQIGAALFSLILAAFFILNKRILLYIGLFGFCFITSVGISPFMMTLPSELFPTSLRAFANGLTQLTTGFSAFICVKIFVNITANLGITYNFLLYTIISLIGAVVGYLLPETAKTVIK